MAEIKPAKMLSLRLSKLPAKQVEASVAQDPLFDKALAVFGDHREVSLVTKPPVVPQELTDKEGGELISIKVPKTERDSSDSSQAVRVIDAFVEAKIENIGEVARESLKNLGYQEQRQIIEDRFSISRWLLEKGIARDEAEANLLAASNSSHRLVDRLITIQQMIPHQTEMVDPEAQALVPFETALDINRGLVRPRIVEIIFEENPILEQPDNILQFPTQTSPTSGGFFSLDEAVKKAA